MWHQTDLPQAAQHREQLDASTRAVAELAGELSSVRNRLSEVEQARAAILARLVEAGLPEDSDETELVAHLDVATRMHARLSALPRCF
jgi:exonuclease SbcC